MGFGIKAAQLVIGALRRGFKLEEEYLRSFWVEPLVYFRVGNKAVSCSG